MRIRVSAVAIESDTLLTVRFSYSGKYVYALPGGGVERGEPILESLKREWNDELGVNIEPGRLLIVGDAPGDKRHPRTLHLVFEAQEVSGKPRLIKGATGGQDMYWIPKEEIADSALYPDIGHQLMDVLSGTSAPLFIPNCMVRGFW